MAKVKAGKASGAVKMAPLRDPPPAKPTVPMYSILERGIETALAQGKRFTPNNFKNNINSTGMSPRELEHQLAGTKEQLEIWKEAYGENGTIPIEEVRKFAQENNATKTIQHRRQRMHPNAFQKDLSDTVIDPEPKTVMSDFERDDLAVQEFADANEARRNQGDVLDVDFDENGTPIQPEPTFSQEELRAARQAQGYDDLYSEKDVMPHEILQAKTRKNPAVSLGENPRSVKTARYGDFTYPQQELAFRDRPASRELRELQEKARFLGGDTEAMRRKLNDIYSSLIPTPFSSDPSSIRKNGPPLTLSLDDPMRTYQEDLFIPNPASPQADVPFSELAASGSFGKAIQEDPAKFLKTNNEYIDVGGVPRISPPMGNYGVPTRLDMTLNEAPPIDQTDAHNNPHYRSYLTPDDSARVLASIQHDSAQKARLTAFAKDKTRDLHPLLAYQLDPKAGTYVAQGQLLRQMAEEGKPVYLPTGPTVTRSDLMPDKPSIDKYGQAGGIHGTSTRSLLDRLLAEGVPESEVTFGPAPGDYSETHNQLKLSDTAIAYLMKHGIRALTVGGLTGAGAAAMDQAPEQQVGY